MGAGQAYDPGTIIPNLIAGPSFLVLGIVVVIFRKKLRDVTVAAEKMMYGQRRGEAYAKWQTSFSLGFTGVLITGMGVVTTVTACIALFQHLSAS